MLLRHFLAKGHTDIPLKNARYFTEHTQRGDAGQHVGWKIAADYAGDSARSAKHRYEFIFTPAEAREFRDKLDQMLTRFDADVSTLIEAGDASLDIEDEE
jgi:hypothetical protein